MRVVRRLNHSNIIAHTRDGGLAQLARALALHARGHRFDSDILHDEYFKKYSQNLSLRSVRKHTPITKIFEQRSLTYW